MSESEDDDFCDVALHCLLAAPMIDSRKQLVLDGWERSCTGCFDVNSPVKRAAAHDLVYLRKLDTGAVPEETEADGYAESDEKDSMSPSRVSLASRVDACASKLNNTATC